LLLNPARLHAQAATPAGPDTVRLTLRDAVQLALKQNPTVQVALLNTAQANEDKNIARSALLPQAGGKASWEYQRLNTAALIGGVSPNFPPVIGPFQIVQGGPVFGANIFDLTLWRRLQGARAGVRGSQAQQMGVREQIVLLTVSQYLGILRSSADVKAAQSRVGLAQALYDLAADLQKNGVGTGIDTLRANVQLQNEKQRLIQAEVAQRVGLSGLQRLLNLDSRKPIQLADEVSFFETPPIDVNQELEQAWATRPELKVLFAQEQAAQASKNAAWEQRIPRLSTQGFWAYQGLTWATTIPAYTVQLTADVPIFTGGRIQAQNTRASLELKKIAQQRQELRNQIALEVNTAAAELEAARNEVNVANQGMALAQEEVVQARDRFQAGVANNIEVITAQDEMSRASDNQIAALYRYNQARADLAHAVGQMESLYSK
jgi:outer membrane protein TolC